MRLKHLTTTAGLAASLALTGCLLTTPALAQDVGEPTLDELLGITEADPQGVDPQNPKPPAVDRDLERRLTGQERAEQFEQAIAEMAEAALRLGEDEDPGIDTQRLQDEIILKLEHLIASAQPQQSESTSSSGQPPEARQADSGGQPQQGQQPGQQPQPGQGEQPGDQQGQEGQGEQPGQKPGSQAGGQEANQGGFPPGSLREGELSMEDLREGEWGNLPPRLRDELSESLGESFNPVYRAMTEAFYRRIAEMSREAAQMEEESE